MSFLFEGDFLTEQVNFIFCPPQEGRTERVLAVQVLFDDSRALGGSVPQILQSVYRMPPPVFPYQPVLAYPLPVNLPVTYWDLGAVEAVYQPVRGTTVTGQLWLTDKNTVQSCQNMLGLVGSCPRCQAIASNTLNNQAGLAAPVQFAGA